MEEIAGYDSGWVRLRAWSSGGKSLEAGMMAGWGLERQPAMIGG